MVNVKCSLKTAYPNSGFSPLKKIMYRSEQYKDFIRNKPCCICGGRAEPHHEPLGCGGKGINAPDSYCLPLCRGCHRERHDVGVSTFWHDGEPQRLIIKYLTEYLGEIDGDSG